MADIDYGDRLAAAHFDEVLNFQRGNAAAHDLLGEQFYDSIFRLIPEKNVSRLKDRLSDWRAEEIPDGDTHSFVTKVRDCSGAFRHMLLMILPEEGGWYIRFVDLAELDQYYHSTSMEERKLRDYLTLAGVNAVNFDPVSSRLRVFWVNQSADMVLYDMALEDFRAMVSERGFVSAGDMPKFLEFTGALPGISERTEFSFVSGILTHGEAECRDHLVLLPFGEGEGKQVIGIWEVAAFDGTEGNLSEERKKTRTDPLTGLLNKTAITEFAEREIRQEQGNVAICVIDMDQFKQINDTYGHLVGDRVLVEAAEIMKRQLPASTTAGRIGGDEFMLVIRNFRDETEIRNCVRIVKENIPFICRDVLQDRRISCSIGVSRCPQDGRIFEKLFRTADTCLYLAKKKGGNRYIIFKPELHAQYLNEEDSHQVLALTQERENHSAIRRAFRGMIVKGSSEFGDFLKVFAECFAFDRCAVYWDGKIIASWRKQQTEKDVGGFIPPDTLCSSIQEADFQDGIYKEDNTNTLEYRMPALFHLYRENGVKSLVQAQLSDEAGCVRGYLSVEFVTMYQTISPGLVTMAESAAEVISGVLIRENC